MLNIYTFAAVRPDFIPLQVRSFQKNILGDFRLTVFNNAVFADKSESLRNGINEECNKLGVTMIDIERDKEVVDECERIEDLCPMFRDGGYSNPNVACAYPLVWAWKKIISKASGPICLLHSDVFLISSIDFDALLRDYDLIYLPQFRAGAGTYMWEVLAVMDLSKLPSPESMNWYCGKVNGIPVDVGGQTCHYLQAHPDLRQLVFSGPVSYHMDSELFMLEGKTIALHYRSGSNWNHKPAEFHQEKTEWLKRMLA